MTPEHPRWQEFVDKLEGSEGCNFRKDETEKIVWNCSDEDNHAKSRRILASMGVEVDKSIEFFQTHGGHCDCEVLFNVKNRHDWEKSKEKKDIDAI